VQRSALDDPRVEFAAGVAETYLDEHFRRLTATDDPFTVDDVERYAGDAFPARVGDEGLNFGGASVRLKEVEGLVVVQ
jgi:hypothetical protein